MSSGEGHPLQIPTVPTVIDPGVLQELSSNPISTVDSSLVGAILRDLYLFFALDDREHPDGVIHPGEPVSFTWGVFSFRQPNNVEVSSWRNSQARLTLNGNTIWGPNRSRSSRLEPSALPRSFYTVNTMSTLVMDVEAPDGAASLTRSLVIAMVPELVGSSWFSWQGVPSSEIRWKQDGYTLGGTILNRSRWSSFSFQPNLHEEPVVAPGGTLAHDYGAPPGAPLAVAHAGSAECFWPAITQAWMPWFDRATLIVSDDRSRRYRYSVQLTATDEYANPYVIASDPVDISITVAEWKIDDVNAAFFSQAAAGVVLAGAVIAGITGLLGAALAAVAGVLEGAAQILAGAALDPPEADPHFEVVEELAPQPRPRAARASEVTNLAAIGAALTMLAEGQGVLSRTHGRLLGALLAGDKPAARLQAQQYGRVVFQMTEALTSLLADLAAAAAVFDTAGYDPVKAASQLRKWRARGLPKRTVATLRKHGLSVKAINGLDLAVRNPQLAMFALDPVAVISSAANALARVTLALRDQAPRVMALPNRVSGRRLPRLEDLTLRRL